MAPSSAQTLFGASGDILVYHVNAIAQDVIGTEYQFMNNQEYERLLLSSPSEAHRIYWVEMLCRAHWAAASNILRHKRWLEACIRLYEEQPNFLGFSACLRGFVEASADAVHSLDPVPVTLAANNQGIRNGLIGKATKLAVCGELEDMLIHFQFARKLAKGEASPVSQQAAAASAYLSTADAFLDTAGAAKANHTKNLYAELCQVVHPAANSLLWMSTPSQEEIRLSLGDDRSWIEDICQRHAFAIQCLQMLSVNTSILVLKVLNSFPLKALCTPYVEKLKMDCIRIWSKIEATLANSSV
jgi:hypothetical protein